MNKKAFVKGKYLEPLIGAGIGPVLTYSDPEIENTRGNLATSAVVGGVGTSLLGRYTAKQGADFQRLNRIPRNYFLKGRGRDYVTTGKTSAEKIRNARKAALDQAENEPLFTGTLGVEADFKNSIKPLYEKELNPRIKDVQDTLFGLDFRKVFTPKLNKAQRSLDREAMLSTLGDDLSEASRRGWKKRNKSSSGSYGRSSGGYSGRAGSWRRSQPSGSYEHIGVKFKDGNFVDAAGNPLKKADIKKKHRSAAMKHHPDRGGDEKVMKAVNKEWEDIKNTPGFDKMAYLIRKGYRLTWTKN